MGLQPCSAYTLPMATSGYKGIDEQLKQRLYCLQSLCHLLPGLLQKKSADLCSTSSLITHGHVNCQLHLQDLVKMRGESCVSILIYIRD